MSSLPVTLTNTIHLRDFVDSVVGDPTRADTNYIEIQTDINIFEEDRFYSSNIIVKPIPTRIRAYVTQAKRDLYIPNAFFYADGRFTAAVTSNNILEITVHAFNLMRHPGDVSDFDEYRGHLPERWCPIVTIIGSVGNRSNDESLNQFELRYFELQTSVYDSSKAAPVQFSVVCFFERGKRWQNVKIPPLGFYISVTAKIVGRIMETNCLALRVLDLAYLPRSGSIATTSDAPLTPTSKRSNRWDGRVDSSTPSKKMRKSEPDAASANRSEESSTIMADTVPHTPPVVENDEAELQLPTTSAEILNETRHGSPSPSPVALTDLQSAHFPLSSQTTVVGRIGTAIQQKYLNLDNRMYDWMKGFNGLTRILHGPTAVLLVRRENY